MKQNSLFNYLYYVILLGSSFSLYGLDPKSHGFTGLHAMGLINQLIKQGYLNDVDFKHFKDTSGRYAKLANYLKDKELTGDYYIFWKEDDKKCARKLSDAIREWIKSVSPHNTPPKEQIDNDSPLLSPKTTLSEEHLENLLYKEESVSEALDCLQQSILELNFKRRSISPYQWQQQESLLTQALKQTTTQSTQTTQAHQVSLNDEELFMEGMSLRQILEQMEKETVLSANKDKIGSSYLEKFKNLTIQTKDLWSTKSKKRTSSFKKQRPSSATVDTRKPHTSASPKKNVLSQSYIPSSPHMFLELLFEETSKKKHRKPSN